MFNALILFHMFSLSMGYIYLFYAGRSYRETQDIHAMGLCWLQQKCEIGIINVKSLIVQLPALPTLTLMMLPLHLSSQMCTGVDRMHTLDFLLAGFAIILNMGSNKSALIGTFQMVV